MRGVPKEEPLSGNISERGAGDRSVWMGGRLGAKLRPRLGLRKRERERERRGT